MEKLKRILKRLKDKKILILGFGLEGKSTLKFLRKYFKNKKILIADQKNLRDLDKEAKEIILKDKDLKLYLGKDYLKSIKESEVIFKSPGIPNYLIKPYLTKEKTLTSQTEIFLKLAKEKTIGVTGTKGKSTTATLIYEVLKKDSKLKPYLIGNIGNPVLNYLDKIKEKNSVFVIELSAHQLSNLKESPHIAILLAISEDHLDYYLNFKDYLKAKTKITKYQTSKDYLIFDKDNKFSKEIAKKSKAKKISLSTNKAYFLKKLKIKSLYKKIYLKNFLSAYFVGKLLNFKEKEILSALEKFKPLPYRLKEESLKPKGITFYNDSAASAPLATIEALKNLPKVNTLILGGEDRGVSLQDLVLKIKEKNIKNLIVFEETRERLWQEIQKAKFKKVPKVFTASNLKDAVKLSIDLTPKKGVVLFSPAFPSFNSFRNFKERGQKFSQVLKRLSLK